MPIEIDGKKYSVKDIEGTDLDVLRCFLRDNKLDAGMFVYVDQDGEIEYQMLHTNKRGKQQLEWLMNAIARTNDIR